MTKNKSITFRIDSELRKKLDVFAQQRGISRSAAVNVILFDTMIGKQQDCQASNQASKA